MKCMSVRNRVFRREVRFRLDLVEVFVDDVATDDDQPTMVEVGPTPLGLSLR